MKMNRYILFCLSHILLLSCQGQSKSSNVSKDSIYVNSKMMDQQELMQTSILSKYGKDNGYNPLSYQDFQNRCMEYWGLSLHKEPKDYVLSIGGYTEYTINEWGRFLYTEAENLFYQPEIDGEPTKEDARKMLYDKENGIADKFLAYNKLLFNDNITTLSFFIRNPEYAIDVVFNHDYERNKILTARSIDFSKKTTDYSVYRDNTEKVLFYNNRKRGFRRNLINEIYLSCNKTQETMAPFDDLVYAYFKQFKQLNYPQDVKDKCLVHLLKCLIEYDRNHKDAIIGIEDEKSYQHLSNFMSKDKHLVDRLKKQDYYGVMRLKELVDIVLVMENDINPNDIYFVDDPDGYTNLREKGMLSSKVLKHVPTNEMITILDNNGNWWKVQVKDGTVGYIHKSRIRRALQKVCQ